MNNKTILLSIIATIVTVFIWFTNIAPTPLNIIQKHVDFFNLGKSRLKKSFEKAGIPYPPQKVSFLAFKEERRLEIWAPSHTGNGAHIDWQYIHSYPILGASGVAGPKLREGDRQVPEGIYRVTFLNPNSRFHLSMKINYPNAFDRKYARLEGRLKPGSNIFIHGDNKSIGCLAMGDAVIEELYALAENTGIHNMKVIIAPYDMRTRAPVFNGPALPRWLPELYSHIGEALADYPVQRASI